MLNNRPDRPDLGVRCLNAQVCGKRNLSWHRTPSLHFNKLVDLVDERIGDAPFGNVTPFLADMVLGH